MTVVSDPALLLRKDEAECANCGGEEGRERYFREAEGGEGTEILLGKDLIRRIRRAEELGCMIESARMAEDVVSLKEELDEE